MPENVRALLVILALATAAFSFVIRPAWASAFIAGDFERRRNLWFGITLAAFLSQDFWIFIIVAAVLLLYAYAREPNKLAMFFFLIFAVPPLQKNISGFGVLNYLFTINYGRLLVLVILLPTFLSLRRKPETERFGRSLPDLFILGYLVLHFLLILKASTVTNAVRVGFFYAFIDTFLPYYVASRSLRNVSEFRDTLMAFVAAAMVLSIISGFEVARHWLVYSSLQKALDAPTLGLGFYLERGQGSGLLRAQATVDSIPLGYVIAIATVFFFYLKKFIRIPKTWYLGLALLMLGQVSALSRGPWVGAASMLLVFIATSPSGTKHLVKLGLIGIIFIPALLVTPLGDTVISYLPFVGTVEAENVVYRQRLIEIAISVMLQNPFFGASDYLNAPEMQDLYAGGMIDVVNTYLGVGLYSGGVGLFLFLSFFVTVIACVCKRMSSLPDRNSELYLLGQVLLSALVGILVIIGTVSSITVIPVVYWSVGGVAIAYARLQESAKSAVPSPEVAGPHSFQTTAIQRGY